MCLYHKACQGGPRGRVNLQLRSGTGRTSLRLPEKGWERERERECMCECVWNRVCVCVCVHVGVSVRERVCVHVCVRERGRETERQRESKIIRRKEHELESDRLGGVKLPLISFHSGWDRSSSYKELGPLTNGSPIGCGGNKTVPQTIF